MLRNLQVALHAKLVPIATGPKMADGQVRAIFYFAMRGQYAILHSKGIFNYCYGSHVCTKIENINYFLQIENKLR